MIEVNNLTKSKIDRRFLITVAKKVIIGENIKKGELSIALISPAEIKKLNKRYRRKNQPTDVLAFGQDKNFFEPELEEVIICPAVVRKNAKKYKVGFKKELTRVLIHGILHLFGYDHEKGRRQAKKMENKEMYYFKKLFNSKR